MSDGLNVLVLESEQHAGRFARDELEQAGHTVLSCHENGAPAFPCNALAEGHDDLRVGHVVVPLLQRALP